MKKTLTILFSCLSTSMMAQGTLADYNRAYGLREKFSAKKILHSGVEPHWIDDTETFWYKTTTEEGEVYVKIDPATGSRSVQQDTTGAGHHRTAHQSAPAVAPRQRRGGALLERD